MHWASNATIYCVICNELSIVVVDDEYHLGLSLGDSNLKVKEEMYLVNLSYLMHTDFLCLNSTNLTLSSYLSSPIHHTSSRKINFFHPNFHC